MGPSRQTANVSSLSQDSLLRDIPETIAAAENSSNLHATKVPSHPSQQNRDSDQRHSMITSKNPSYVEQCSKERHEERNMSSADSATGDTQVMSQSVFDSIIRQSKDAQEHDSLDFGTLKTLHEGDVGHIDLLAGFDNNTHQDPTKSENHDDNSSNSKIGESSPVHFQQALFPESQRFVKSTPSSAMKRMDHDHMDSVTSASRNPLPSDTGTAGGVMALSQVFQATQIPSSPLPGPLPSETMPERPSPAVPIQNFPTTAAIATLSSPSLHRPAFLNRRLSESQSGYVTMEESQARRDKIIEDGALHSATNVGDVQADGEFAKESSFVKRLHRQNAIDENAREQFAGKGAPRKPTSSQRIMQHQDHEATTRELLAQEKQGPGEIRKDFRDGGISEEETEQEEDETEREDNLEPRGSPSREPIAGSEEDKENYGTLAMSPLAGASTHERLSQVLGQPESPSHGGQPLAEPYPFTRYLRNSSHAKEIDMPGTSSQSVVRDSQQSVEQKHDESEAASGKSNRRSTSQSLFSLVQKEQGASSPARKVPIQSSPPLSRHPRRRNHESSERNHFIQRDRSATRGSSVSPSSHISATQISKNTPDNHDEMHQNPPDRETKTNQADADVVESISGLEAFDRPLAVVTETPVHPQQTAFMDTKSAATTTTIPETSERHRHQRTIDGNPDQDDDGLPSMLPIHIQSSLSLPSSSRFQSPMKTPSNKRLFSSPSGKQRRALTEIAADASPQVEHGQFDVGLDMLTADDRQFSALVGVSPAPPKKKLRGNNGLGAVVSDPILPVTPLPVSPQFTRRYQRDETNLAEANPRESVNRSESVRRKDSSISRQSSSIWDVESSPPYNPSRIVQPRRKNAEPNPLNRRRDLSRKPKRRELASSEDSHGNDEATTLAPAENGDRETHPVGLYVHSEQSEQVSVPDHDSDPVQIAPYQVIALWKGPPRPAYYPATCFGRPMGMSQSQYVVKFEDALPVEVSAGFVKRLELHIGDTVKVDKPNVPKVAHTVCGLGGKLSSEVIRKGIASGCSPMTDIYGHSTVTLKPKKRTSLPKGGEVGPEHIVHVPISSLYFDMSMGSILKDRNFTAIADIDLSESKNGFQTPSDRKSTPTTPSTRLSRSVNYSRGLFSNMIFAVSFADDNAKTRITELIRKNDGRVLDEGFDELFEYPAGIPEADVRGEQHNSSATGHNDFKLDSVCEDAGFVCLIADKHSRRVKYMQALALNLPCLSGRWIEDCVNQDRILDWEIYLLPSGESAYLDGATKSRILTPSPATTARLSETITGRPKLFEGKSVLAVMGRGRTEKKRKPYIFLTYALGASKVERVSDLEDARALLDKAKRVYSEPQWELIYVDDSERLIATNMLLGGSDIGIGSGRPSATRIGKKRKKSDMTRKDVGGDHIDDSAKVRIVGNEYICQSLILGKLF